MNQREVELSERLFRKKYEQLGKQEQHVAHHLAERTHIARNVSQDLSEDMTFGQKLADKVASFGGSWTFISIFAASMDKNRFKRMYGYGSNDSLPNLIRIKEFRIIQIKKNYY